MREDATGESFGPQLFADREPNSDSGDSRNWIGSPPPLTRPTSVPAYSRQ